MNETMERPLPIIETEQQNTPATAVAVVDLKALALSRFGTWLPGARALVERFRAVAFDPTTPKGYAELVKAISEVRAPRFAAQNVAKASKSELAGISKAIGAEEAAVAAYLADTEARLVKIRDDHDTQVAADKAEAKRIDDERIAKHQAGIATIRSFLARCQGLPSSRIADGISQLEAQAYGEGWEEFRVQAANAQCETLEAMRALHAQTFEREAETARLEAQRIENERVAAELAEARRKIEAERAELAAARAESERLEKAAVLKREWQALQDRAAADAAEAKRIDAMKAEAAKMPDLPQERVGEIMRELCPAFEAGVYHGPTITDAAGNMSRLTLAVSAPLPEPTLTLGAINERIAPLSITGVGLALLGFEPAGKRKAAVLFHESTWPAMLAAMVASLTKEKN